MPRLLSPPLYVEGGFALKHIYYCKVAPYKVLKEANNSISLFMMQYYVSTNWLVYRCE